MREIAFSFVLCAFPDAFDVFLETTESFFFGDTGIGYAVVVVF